MILFIFAIKNFNDFNLRNLLIENIQLQNKLEYKEKLINSMTGLHVSFSGKRLEYMNDNVKSLLKTIKREHIQKSKFFNFFI